MKGSCFLISANIPHSMEKIIPQEQSLFPVSFKRKLSYEGFFMEEVIDKEKIIEWFKWLKQNNEHFRDIELSIEKIDDFEESSRKKADEMERISTVTMTVPEDEFEKEEATEEIPLSKQNTTLMVDKYEIDPKDKSYQNLLADLIVKCEILHDAKEENNDFDDFFMEDLEEDEFQDEDEKDNDESEDTLIPRKRTKYSKISIAPGEGGKFHNWSGDNLYIEEQAFVHLFPRGQVHNFHSLDDIKLHYKILNLGGGFICHEGKTMDINFL